MDEILNSIDIYNKVRDFLSELIEDESSNSIDNLEIHNIVIHNDYIHTHGIVETHGAIMVNNCVFHISVLDSLILD